MLSGFDIERDFPFFTASDSESLSKLAIIALIFCPGVRILGELPAEDAERVVRGVDGEVILVKLR